MSNDFGNEIPFHAYLKAFNQIPVRFSSTPPNLQPRDDIWPTDIDAGKPSALPARVVSVRGYIPDHLDQEMTVKAAQLRVTKTFLLIEALAQAGYRVDPIDLNQDRRRNKA